MNLPGHRGLFEPAVFARHFCSHSYRHLDAPSRLDAPAANTDVYRHASGRGVYHPVFRLLAPRMAKAQTHPLGHPFLLPDLRGRSFINCLRRGHRHLRPAIFHGILIIVLKKQVRHR